MGSDEDKLRHSQRRKRNLLDRLKLKEPKRIRVKHDQPERVNLSNYRKYILDTDEDFSDS